MIRSTKATSSAVYDPSSGSLTVSPVVFSPVEYILLSAMSLGMKLDALQKHTSFDTIYDLIYPFKVLSVATVLCLFDVQCRVSGSDLASSIGMWPCCHFPLFRHSQMFHL